MALSHNFVDDQNDTQMEEDFMTGIPFSEDLPETDMEDPRHEETTFKVIKEVASTIQTSLEQGEKNALDVTSAVDQVLKLTDRDLYKLAVNAIFSDPKLSTEDKLKLKAAVDAKQDEKDAHATQRVIEIQSSQKNSVIEILRMCGIVFAVGAGGLSIVYLCGTGKGRTILDKVVTWAIEDVPRIFSKGVA